MNNRIVLYDGALWLDDGYGGTRWDAGSLDGIL